MLKNKRVLINGCSFSRGSGSWPYWLQSKTGCNIVNLSQCGAGNKYIHQSTITELARREYDLVLIMWGGLSWVDCQVEDIEKFKNIEYTSLNQSKLNDWPEKQIIPINDQDYVEKNWIFAVTNNDDELKKLNFCATQFEYMGKKEHLTQSLIHMIGLQNTLKQLQLHYVFSFYKDYQPALKQHELYKFLDLENVCNTVNLASLAHEKDMYDNTDHPTVEAYNLWSDVMLTHLKTKTYAKTA